MQEAAAPDRGSAIRCGIDTVEISRIERLLRENEPGDLLRFFSAQELADGGEGAGRAAHLAARFAAKEACVKLFPREAALGDVEPADFSVARDAYGAPQPICNARAAAVLARNRVRTIALSLTHDRVSASAVALAIADAATAPLAGSLLYRLLPFRRGVVPKRGSLDAILDRLAAGDAIVFPFDQHAGPPDGIEVDFFGYPAWTFKSLALIALASDAHVLPAASWRKDDGTHVLRFEEPLLPVSCAEVGEEIRRNTRAYNAALERLILRHPEQWYWVHRRWKRVDPRARARRA